MAVSSLDLIEELAPSSGIHVSLGKVWVDTVESPVIMCPHLCSTHPCMLLGLVL